jgi:cytochrome c556
MYRPNSRTIVAIVLAIPLLTLGCKKEETVGSGTPGPMPMADSAAGSPSHQIMIKIGRGPNSLSSLLDQELKADPTPWDTIQPQAAEYAKLAAEFGKQQPTKGDKDSWTNLTKAFADHASALDRAAQAKDLAAAKEAQTSLGASCMGCHREHRPGPGGKKGKGGPPA